MKSWPSEQLHHWNSSQNRFPSRFLPIPPSLFGPHRRGPMVFHCGLPIPLTQTIVRKTFVNCPIKCIGAFGGHKYWTGIHFAYEQQLQLGANTRERSVHQEMVQWLGSWQAKGFVSSTAPTFLQASTAPAALISSLDFCLLELHLTQQPHLTN